ncbi:MAG TPA: pitrilysin family protein, partial [Kofleriaceae bacterium]|nr:pitrilysin family protein [Kofleriaceae bacterium]
TLPAIQQFSLENGLKVVLLRDTSTPVVAVQVWYHAGSKDEPRDRRGSAHMFEHMMFRGTTHVRPDGHARFISSLGGDYNAQTTEDATFYKDTVPSAYLDFVVGLEAERMRNLLFRPDMIDTEREVVKEEIRRQLGDPIVRGLLRFLAVAYQKHPYAWTAGGTIEDLDHTTPADLKAFYDTYYQPSNALLVVVGDATLDDVRAAAEKHFGRLPAAPPPPRPAQTSPEPPQTEQRREVLDPSQVGLVFAGYKLPPGASPDIPALQVTSVLLGAGESARLRQRVKAVDPKTKKPLGLDAAVPFLVREDPGIFLTIGVFRDPANAGPIEAALFDEVGKLAKKPPAADEVARAKAQILASFVFGMDSPQGLAEQLGQAWVLTGDPATLTGELAAVDKVTPADIARVVSTYLVPTKSTVVVVPPVSTP